MKLVDALTWNEPIKCRGGNTDADVSIGMSICHSKNGQQYVKFNFIFRNEIWKLISPKGEKVSYAVGFGVVAFREDERGWTLSPTPRSKSMRVQVTVRDGKTIESLKKMIGDYDLQEDDGIYYVQKGGKR